MFQWLLALVLGIALPLTAAVPKVALLGPFPVERCVDVMAAQMALDAANRQPGAPHVGLAVFNGGDGDASNIAAAHKLVADPEVMAVVLHGEAAASPAVLAVLRQAGLAVISASSWAQPRAAGSGVTWLCPTQVSMADSAAIYARKEARCSQVAVVDNGSVTSTAATQAFADRFRALGGKVHYEGTWTGDPAFLDEVVKGLVAHWPQMVFFAGDAAAAGRLLVAMKAEKALKPADMIGPPSLFKPIFFEETRLKGLRTLGLFPCPDFPGTGALARLIGVVFPRLSTEYKAYVRFAFRRPERWTSMLFDATALAAKAVDQGLAPSAATPSAVAAQGLTRVAAQGLTPVAAALPARTRVDQALAGIPGYVGIRGRVKFSAAREPADPKVMIYYALNHVSSKVMTWRERSFGPPF